MPPRMSPRTEGMANSFSSESPIVAISKFPDRKISWDWRSFAKIERVVWVKCFAIKDSSIKNATITRSRTRVHLLWWKSENYRRSGGALIPPKSAYVPSVMTSSVSRNQIELPTANFTAWRTFGVLAFQAKEGSSCSVWSEILLLLFGTGLQNPSALPKNE